jgi:hypothetical protein
MPRPATTRLSGIAYHLGRDAVVAVTYAAVVVGGLFVVALALQPTGGLRTAFDRVMELVTPGEVFPGLGLLLVLLISSFPAGLHWQRAVRAMRALPIAPVQLVALLLAVPLWRWLAFWAIGLALTAIAGRVTAPFPLDVLLALTGICALIQATSFRWSGARPTLLISVVIVALLIVSAVLSVLGEIAVTAASLGLSLAMITGLLTLAAAALMNYHTLTRRAATYQRPVTAEASPI